MTQEKIDFVSNLNGSHPGEVIWFICLAILVYMSWKCLPEYGVLGVQIRDVWIPMMLLMAVVSVDWTTEILASFPVFAVYLIKWMLSLKRKKEWNAYNIVSVFRGILQFSTIIAILAVDFPIYPRKYAKTESYGYSIMDVGVGIYVFSSGIVSKVDKLDLWNGIKATLIMLVIGTGRMVLTKVIGYQEHVSEYGTHWNFFFTCK